MTEETEKRLPGILERIDELGSEVKEIHEAEDKEMRAKCEVGTDRINEIWEVGQFYRAYTSLNDAFAFLESF